MLLPLLSVCQNGLAGEGVLSVCVCVQAQIHYLCEQGDWQASLSKECQKTVTSDDVLARVGCRNVVKVNLFLTNCNHNAR